MSFIKEKREKSMVTLSAKKQPFNKKQSCEKMQATANANAAALQDLQPNSSVTNEKNQALSATMQIVLTAMFIALAAVSNSFLTVRVGAFLKFSATLTVYFFAGYILGAPLGFLVGVIGDVLGWLLFTDGAYNPVIGLSYGLNCFIPAIIFGFRRPVKTLSPLNFALKSFAGFALSYIICTVFLTSLGIWLYTSYIQSKYSSFLVWIVYRISTQSLNNLANYVLSVALFFSLKAIKPLKKYL